MAGLRKAHSAHVSESEHPEATEASSLLNGQQQLDAEVAGEAPVLQRRWSGLDDFQGLPMRRTPSVFWLLFPYAVFTLAFGGIIVPKLNLILDLVCKRYMADQELVAPDLAFRPVVLGGENPQCKIPAVAKNTASFMLVMGLCTGILSSIVVPKLGQLSDRYGRTRFMAIASVGGISSEVITILAAKFPETVDYRWLILGSFFDGLTGSFTAGSVLTQAYSSDCTPPSKRAVYMGYIHACLFFGLAFGPLLAGYFVKWTGSLLSIFYVALGCHIFYMLFIGLVVPESLSKKKRLIAQEKWENETRFNRAVAAWNPFQPLTVLWPVSKGTSMRLRLNLVILAFHDFLVVGTAMSAGPVILLYSEVLFKWGNFETSQFMSAVSLARVVALVGLLPLINYTFRILPVRRQRRLSGVEPVEKNAGMDRVDLWVLRGALVCDICGYLGYTLSRSPAWFVLSGISTAFGGLAGATVSASLTKHVPPERVGQTLGAVGLLHALARVVGPSVFNGVFIGTVEKFPQAIFVLMIGLLVPAVLSTFALKLHIHWDEKSHEEQEPLSDGHRAFQGAIDDLPTDQDHVIVS